MSRARKIITADLHGLSNKELNFVIEYCKDFSARRAAEASGYAPDTGYSIKEKPLIDAAIQKILGNRLEASHIDAEWVLMQAVDNCQIALQQGNISASNTALTIVAKHTFVDAFAAEKVEVSSDADVMARLLRGRERARNNEEEVSFM